MAENEQEATEQEANLVVTIIVEWVTGTDVHVHCVWVTDEHTCGAVAVKQVRSLDAWGNAADKGFVVCEDHVAPAVDSYV